MERIVWPPEPNGTNCIDGTNCIVRPSDAGEGSGSWPPEALINSMGAFFPVESRFQLCGARPTPKGVVGTRFNVDVAAGIGAGDWNLHRDCLGMDQNGGAGVSYLQRSDCPTRGLGIFAIAVLNWLPLSYADLRGQPGLNLTRGTNCTGLSTDPSLALPVR